MKNIYLKIGITVIVAGILYSIIIAKFNINHWGGFVLLLFGMIYGRMIDNLRDKYDEYKTKK
jgi:hypothetical protein